VAASGELGLGELGEMQRRYFKSFSLAVEIAPSEDAYEALLKRRWREISVGIK
jgi:hypothetical protein